MPEITPEQREAAKAAILEPAQNENPYHGPDLDGILDALIAQGWGPGGVRVRALKWTDFPGYAQGEGADGCRYEAYEVMPGLWRCGRVGAPRLGERPILGEAQALAQSDYDARVRLHLEADPAGWGPSAMPRPGDTGPGWRRRRRASAILGLRMGMSLDSGWIDAKAGVVHFEGARQRKTKKRRGSIQATSSLASHARRWARLGGTHAVMWRGEPVAEIDTALAAAAKRAGVIGVTPHVLKHTAVTWAFQQGMTIEDAADWFATSPATLMKHYRAHSPHYQARARSIMERKSGRNDMQ